MSRTRPSLSALAIFAWALACGPSSTAPAEETAEEHAGDETTHSQASEDAADARREDDVRAGACEGRLSPQCRSEDGCIWDGACRAVADACEVVVPDPSWQGEPVFDRGDPCENARAGCAWSTARHRCVPFAAVPACPATLQEAQATVVACDHPGQPALECAYGETRCSCVRSQYCGGAAPPPTTEYPPGHFTCVPPVDARGCPTGEIRPRSRCRVDGSVVCSTCYTSARCVSGRWQVEELPPRP